MSSPDLHPSAHAHRIKQRHHVRIAHAHAAMRQRHAHGAIVGAAVDVDVAAQRVYCTAAVDAWLTAGQPQDSAQNPVAARVGGG